MRISDCSSDVCSSDLVDWRQIGIFSSLASIVLGAVGAIGQSNIKRLLAYSSINNIGFALIGLAAATPEGIAAVLFYMVVYVAMTMGSFICVLQMRDLDGRPVETIASLSGLSRRSEARRVGKECVTTCIYRGTRCHDNKKK